MELTLLQAADARALLAFETQHRDYFERWTDPRPEHFYTPEGFQQALHTAMLQQRSGLAWHYLIWQSGTLAGRASLLQMPPTTGRIALLSYRIAPGHAGQGLATSTVASVMQKAFQRHRLHKLTATVRAHNQAAIQVLLKNGFHSSGHSEPRPQLHRQWLEVLYFEAQSLPDAAQA